MGFLSTMFTKLAKVFTPPPKPIVGIEVPPVLKKKHDVDNLVFEHDAKEFTNIIVHHSLTKDRRVKDWETIKRYHTSWRYESRCITPREARRLQASGRKPTPPWSDIGYHWGIEKIGDDIVCLKGRAMNKYGAHTKDGGFNLSSIGICMIGDWDLEKPSEERLEILLLLLKRLVKHFKVHTNNVLGHREAQALAAVPENIRKTCPGHLFDMDDLRSRLG